MEHQCKRCHYITPRLSDLKKHLKRITPCETTFSNIDQSILYEECNNLNNNENAPYKCEFCQKGFNHRSGKCNHQKICKHKEESSNKKTKQLEKKIDQLTDLVKTLQTNQNNIQNNNQNNIQNNITINLNNFSHEAISYIPTETIKECLKEMDMARLLELIHFHPDHPENHTVRPRNINRNLLEYFQEGKWHIAIKDKVLEDMINCSGYKVLKTFYRNNKDEIDDEIVEEEEMKPEDIDEWLSKINNEDPKIFKELKQNIFLVIINNKAMVFGR